VACSYSPLARGGHWCRQSPPCPLRFSWQRRPHPLPVHLSIGITIANHSHVHQSGVMSQAWSSTARSQRRSTARDVVEPRPLAVVAAGTVPIGIDLEAPIDDVTGLPLIMCPDCKDVRVFAANTTYSNNVGRRRRTIEMSVKWLNNLHCPNFILVCSG
jgi:hypothetical protein